MSDSLVIGDMLVDGKKADPVSYKEMCDHIISCGLWNGTGEELFNSSKDGSLAHINDLYLLSLIKSGKTISLIVPDENGNLEPRTLGELGLLT